MTTADTRTLSARFRLQLREFALAVDLNFDADGVTALLGPSGSGKTTLLRCLAGLDRDPNGALRFREQVWQDGEHWVPAYQRPIGYVFQDARLFPHLSVRKNLEFGMRRVPVNERRVSFDRAVALLGVAPLLERSPRKLSGGERQRVAIARALLCSPLLLLMDEPLASLDLTSRAQIMPLLEALQRELQLPIVYVTHAPAEVVRLATRVVLLDTGKVLAVGPVHDLLTRPDLPLAHFEDAGALLEARVSEHAPQYHLTYVSVAGGRLAISARPLAVGVQTRVHVRARDVSVSLDPPTRSSITNVLPAHVIDIHPDRDPAHALVRLSCAGSVVLARITQRSVSELGLAAGQAVFAQVKSVAIVE
ncbi:MAG: molybdenum transport protein ModC [Pseudomonadota bacterium]|jgi:molybdate transport system ATP-binding protein